MSGFDHTTLHTLPLVNPEDASGWPTSVIRFNVMLRSVLLDPSLMAILLGSFDVLTACFDERVEG